MITEVPFSPDRIDIYIPCRCYKDNLAAPLPSSISEAQIGLDDGGCPFPLLDHAHESASPTHSTRTMTDISQLEQAFLAYQQNACQHRFMKHLGTSLISFDHLLDLLYYLHGEHGASGDWYISFTVLTGCTGPIPDREALTLLRTIEDAINKLKQGSGNGTTVYRMYRTGSGPPKIVARWCRGEQKVYNDVDKGQLRLCPDGQVQVAAMSGTPQSGTTPFPYITWALRWDFLPICQALSEWREALHTSIIHKQPIIWD